MAALTDSGEISLLDIFRNREDNGSATGTDIDIQSLAVQLASGSTVGDVDGNGTANQTADRTLLNSAPYAFDEFYSANYPNTIFGSVIAKLGSASVMSNGFVDGETAKIEWVITDGTTDDYTAGLKLVSDNSVVVSATLDEDGNTQTVSKTMTVPDIAGASDKYYPFVTTGTFQNSVGANIDHYDQIAGGSAGLSETSRNVDAADESVSNISISPTVSTGTQTGFLRGDIDSVTAGDGGTMTGTYVVEDGAATNAVVIANVPGVIRFNITHYGSPSNARNTVNSTTDYTVSYNRAIDISVSDNTVNSGVAFTITAVSEGLTGAATMRVGYGTSNSNTTYTANSDKSIGAATNFVRNSQSQAFTRNLTSGTSLETFFGKAHYTSGAATLTATSAISIAPLFSYTATANATINVNQTQALGVSSVVGNNASVGITSSPDKGSGTNSATLTPGTNNRIYTISYAGTANYSQTSNISRTVTVNPTVSLSLSDNQSGANNPKNDADGNTIASSTHGISPTLFTATPTVVGDTVSYAWTTSGFTFTSGGGSTAGAVIFKKDSAGTANMTLTVSGNSTSANDAVSIVARTIQKAITDGDKPSTLRAGTTFQVTNITANFTQNIKLVRDGVVIGAAASIAGTMNFSISSTNDYTNNYDSNNVNTLLTDSDHTAITFNLGTTVLLPPLPVIDNFSAATDDFLKKIDLSYDTTSATAVSINQGVGSQAVDADITASGLDNDTEYTFTLTATNAASEAVTDTATASTIDPAISFGTPGDTSITYGDTGTYTIAITKNFKDAIEVHIGHGLNASETGGTEWQILTSQGSGATSFNATFNRNFLGGSTFGSIIDYRAGSSDAGWFHNNTNNSFADFAAPGVPTSLSTSASSGTAIAVTWSNPSSGQTGVILEWGETADEDFPNSVTITNGATSADATGLNHSTGHSFRIKAFITKTTTPLGSSESRTNSSAYSSTVTQATTGWNSFVLEGDAFSGVNSGTGFSTPEAAHLADDVTSGELFYSNSTTLGSNTVAVKRTVDGSPFNGGNAWFLIGGADDPIAVAFIESDGEITAANYYLIANTPPLPPTSISFDNVTDSVIRINWSDNSSIESGFKIYMSTSGAADSGDTLINTTSANATSFTKTGLSSGTTHYFAVYAYRGSSLSTVLQGSQATAAGTSWGSYNGTLSGNCGETGADRSCTTRFLTLTNPDTGTNQVNATISNLSGMSAVNNLFVAVGTSTNPTNWSTGTAQTTAAGSSDVIYVRMRVDSNKAGEESGTFTMTLENNGVSKVTNNLNWTIEEGG
tara:strand:+ start:157 stop:4026 length:3870 start_codon:yes stop_codon:yes gene_type:complete